jgi:hypothetical protein
MNGLIPFTPVLKIAKTLFEGLLNRNKGDTPRLSLSPFHSTLE